MSENKYAFHRLAPRFSFNEIKEKKTTVRVGRVDVQVVITAFYTFFHMFGALRYLGETSLLVSALLDNIMALVMIMGSVTYRLQYVILAQSRR